MSSLFARFITGTVYGRDQIWLAWSISLSTLKRETFDTASKTPPEEKKEGKGAEAANCWILPNMKQEGRSRVALCQ